jgi:chromosome partitioning protein
VGSGGKGEGTGEGKREGCGARAMKTLVTAIQKGGQGKTCVSCHLAFDFQERGCKVVVIDFDTQANASYTL